ncbi:hypothetical protein QTP70_032039, partial [Hemibagrus guttatus]
SLSEEYMASRVREVLQYRESRDLKVSQTGSRGRGTMEHILSSCPRALAEGRYCWHHKQVLKAVAESIGSTIGQARGLRQCMPVEVGGGALQGSHCARPIASWESLKLGKGKPSGELQRAAERASQWLWITRDKPCLNAAWTQARN